jgi:hypothetical protein
MLRRATALGGSNCIHAIKPSGTKDDMAVLVDLVGSIPQQLINGGGICISRQGSHAGVALIIRIHGVVKFARPRK